MRFKGLDLNLLAALEVLLTTRSIAENGAADEPVAACGQRRAGAAARPFRRSAAGP